MLRREGWRPIINELSGLEEGLRCADGAGAAEPSAGGTRATGGGANRAVDFIRQPD
jgi:hypothetical protein